MSADFKYKIGVIGLWHLGEIFSAGLSQLGHKVVGIDEDKQVVENLSKNIPPLPEPELEDFLRLNIAENRLSYTTDFGKLHDCNILWLTFDTPVNENDEVDMDVIYNAVKKAAPYLQENVFVVVTSQLPAGCSKKIQSIISEFRPGLKFEYAYTPENLRLGEAVKCFFNPGRIVIGSDNAGATEKLKDIFSGIKTDFLCMSVASAEMSKHALNAFLATSLSFIYDISDACEAVGADVAEVSKALRSDPRIGPAAYLDSSIGFSGGTLGRDLKALIAIAKNNSMEFPVISGVFEKNEKRIHVAVLRLEKELSSIKGKTIALFGLTYKPGTSTLRRSQALMVAKELENAGAVLSMHDPAAEMDGIKRDPYEAAQGADAVVFLTPWPQFKDLDFVKLRSVMKSPAVCFDTRNFFIDNEDMIRKAGFNYIGIGR